MVKANKTKSFSNVSLSFKSISLAFILLFSFNLISAFNFEGDGVKIVSPTDKYGVEVSLQDYTGRLVSFYATYPLKITNLTTNIYVEDTNITLYNTTGCALGQALDIYDKNNYYQGLIKAINGNTITITPEIDYNFTDLENTVAKCGITNLNVNGLTQKYEFYISPPTNKKWHIESIGMGFNDNLDWDMSTFGSRTALNNGFIVETENGELNELFLIYNNEGFLHRGFTLQNIEKAPAGVYGFSADLEVNTKYRTIIELDGSKNEKIIAEVQDDLTSQSSIRFIIRGHYVNE